jgi:hypothetical protein
MNLYDLTQGNYRVHRTVSYPEYPQSQIVFDTRVRRVSPAEWSTKIEVSGTYDGPTDVVGVDNYRVTWTTDNKTLLEQGSATLKLSSGRTVHTTWTSSIVPDEPRFAHFPRGGETVNVAFSPFRISGNTMSYDWSGTVVPTQAPTR